MIQGWLDIQQWVVMFMVKVKRELNKCPLVNWVIFLHMPLFNLFCLISLGYKVAVNPVA